MTLNPIFKNMICVLHVTQRYLKETPSLSIFSPVWGNNYFAPGRADGGFKIWADKILTKNPFNKGMIFKLYGLLMTSPESPVS